MSKNLDKGGKNDRLRFHRLFTIYNFNLRLHDTRIHNHTLMGIIHMKKYTIRCPYCGSEHKKYEWLLKLFLLHRNTYTHHCPVCHHKSVWLYIFHLRHESTNKGEQLFNKMKLFDDRL